VLEIRIDRAPHPPFAFFVSANSVLVPGGSAKPREARQGRAHEGWLEVLVGGDPLFIRAGDRSIVVALRRGRRHAVWERGENAERSPVIPDVAPAEAEAQIRLGDVDVTVRQQFFRFSGVTTPTRATASLVRRVQLVPDLEGRWLTEVLALLHSGDFPVGPAALGDLVGQVGALKGWAFGLASGTSKLSHRLISADGASFITLEPSTQVVPGVELRVGSAIEEGDTHLFGPLEVTSLGEP
jgi:hypothetical protein